MGESTASVKPIKRVSRLALRVVLFGMPEAGKSSLLGALSQSAESQQDALNGGITHAGAAFAEMKERLYEGTPSETLEEVVPVPLIYSSKSRGRTEVSVLDCNGRIANDMLALRRELDAGRRNDLGRAVLSADAIILAIDASSSEAQIEADFTEFARFLKLLEQSRGEQSAVGGLPVFLVLTKCDRLAQAEDGQATWMDRIEERKHRLGQRFRDFLVQRSPTHTLPFGSLHLHLWATAVKRPQLVDGEARPREPYGVAELFRQAFEHARTYRERRGQAGRRLLLTVFGSLLMVGAMIGVATLLILFRPGRMQSELDRMVTRFQDREQNQSTLEHFQHANTKIGELAGFLRDPDFNQLTTEKQQYVASRLEELKAYRLFEQELDQITNPAEAGSELQLLEIRKKLEALQAPAKHEAEFAQTEAGRRKNNWSSDIDAIHKEIDRIIIGYKQSVNAGNTVLAESSKPKLPDRAKKVLDDARALPDRRTDLGKTIPGSSRITYATVLGITEVETEQRRWEGVRDKLEPFAKFVRPE